jgi:hypothetical protein
MGFLSRLSEAASTSAVAEDDVTVEIKDTDAAGGGAGEAAEAAAPEAAPADESADMDEDDGAVTDEDADTQVDVVNTADSPIVPTSGEKAAPDMDTSNAEVQSEIEEEEEGPEDIEDAFDPKADTTVEVEEEEDPGAIRNQELDDPTADATAVGTDGAQAAVAFSNVGGNEYTKGDADNTDSKAVSEDYFGESDELDVID